MIELIEYKGFEVMLNAIQQMAERRLAAFHQRRREELPLCQLMAGMQCGSRNAFPGVSANRPQDTRQIY